MAGCAGVHVSGSARDLQVVEGGDEGRVHLLLLLCVGSMGTLRSIGMGHHARSWAEEAARRHLPWR
jgi:hypothetical protein